MAVQPLSSAPVRPSTPASSPTSAPRFGPIGVQEFHSGMSALGQNTSLPNFDFSGLNLGTGGSRTAAQQATFRNLLGNTLGSFQGDAAGMTAQAFKDQLRAMGLDPNDAQFHMGATPIGQRSQAEFAQLAQRRGNLIAALQAQQAARPVNNSLPPELLVQFQQQRNNNDSQFSRFQAQNTLQQDNARQDYSRLLADMKRQFSQQREVLDDQYVGRGLMNSGIRNAGHGRFVEDRDSGYEKAEFGHERYMGALASQLLEMQGQHSNVFDQINADEQAQRAALAAMLGQGT